MRGCADLLNRFPVCYNLGLIDPDCYRKRTVSVNPGGHADGNATDPVDFALDIGRYRKDPVFIAKNGFHQCCDRFARTIYRRTFVLDDLFPTGLH